MKKAILYLTLPAILLTAIGCGKSKKNMIAKKWQAAELNSPQMDQVIAEQELFIDTFGKNTDPSLHDSLYGTNNIDSLRQSLQMQVKDYKAMQEHSLKNTWFDFRKDGTVLMNFSGQTDSTKWYFDDKDELVLDEMKLKGTGDKIRLVVEQLEENVLKLQFNEGGVSSTITFHPAKN